jgi:amino-acid N-acetyltransferase
MAAAIHDIQPRPARAAATRLLEAANLPASDLTDEHLDHFFYCGPAASPAGIVGLELYGPDALLRSLVVELGARAAGTGSALVRHAETYALTLGVSRIFLLTTTAEAFFARRGYGRTAREHAPESIRTTREFADICPASSALMVKTL